MYDQLLVEAVRNPSSMKYKMGYLHAYLGTLGSDFEYPWNIIFDIPTAWQSWTHAVIFWEEALDWRVPKRNSPQSSIQNVMPVDADQTKEFGKKAEEKKNIFLLPRIPVSQINFFQSFS